MYLSEDYLLAGFDAMDRNDAESACVCFKIYKNKLSKIDIGDRIVLGRHFLDDGGKPRDIKIKFPINWRVIDKNESKILLFSEYCLDWEFFTFDLEFRKPTEHWLDSDIRHFLNTQYIQEWFSKNEQSLINQTSVITGGNPEISADETAVVTTDKLFLLSYEEVLKYVLGEENAGKVEYSENFLEDVVYTVKDNSLESYILGVHMWSYPKEFSEEVKWDVEWWLRTPGKSAAYIMTAGFKTLNVTGLQQTCDEIGIRPAMWIDINSLDAFIEASRNADNT